MRFILLLPLLSLFLISCQAENDFKWKVLQTEVFDTSVQVATVKGSCSGTVISESDTDIDGRYEVTVLTAKHCFEKETPNEQIIPSDWTVYKYEYTDNIRSNTREYSVQNVSLDENADLAVVTFETTDILPSANILTEEIKNSLQFGEKVFNASFPFSIEQMYVIGTLGHIVKVDESNFLASEVQFVNIPVAPGSSGSALYVLRDNHYYLIGVLTSFIGTGEPNTFTQWSTPGAVLEFINAQ